jgi:hypothetical protein
LGARLALALIALDFRDAISQLCRARMERSGDLIPYNGEYAPEGLTARCQRVFSSLQSLRNQIQLYESQQQQLAHNATVVGQISIRDVNGGIRQTVADLHQLAQELEAALRRYQDHLATDYF